jgi:hypothetical protein
LAQKLPVFPLFGAGETALQPSYVEDVADAAFWTRSVQNQYMSSAARAFIVTANLYKHWPNNSGRDLLYYQFRFGSGRLLH